MLSGTYLEEVNRDPLTEPKQDKPTKTGMIQLMTPRWEFPKSWTESTQGEGSATVAHRQALNSGPWSSLAHDSALNPRLLQCAAILQS